MTQQPPDGATDSRTSTVAFSTVRDGRFLYGAQWYWLAVVAAIRNDAERAVRMLRIAFADGLPMESFVHADPHFVALQGHPQMDALLRPRG